MVFYKPGAIIKNKHTDLIHGLKSNIPGSDNFLNPECKQSLTGFKQEGV